MSEIENKVAELISSLKEESSLSIGYPRNTDFDYSSLYSLLSYSLNNIGDPFVKSSYHVNTFEFEKDVISFFQKIAKADPHSTWGYVTNGGTEGNLYGLMMARERYPTGIVYYSKDAHYSVAKIIKILRIESTEVASLPNGEIDYQALALAIASNKDKPAIIFANIGTTMKGAVDNIDKIKGIMGNVPYYLHADAALSGMILPFVDNPPPFTFEDGINSIAISGHKFIGSPIPCGIVLAEKEAVYKFGNPVNYISSVDSTISGSRNGITPVFLWYAIKKMGIEGFRKDVLKCFAVSDHAIKRLNLIGIKSWRNNHSITVVLQRKCEPVMKKYQIAIDGDIGHIMIMPNVSKQIIDNFVDELEASINAFS